MSNFRNHISVGSQFNYKKLFIIGNGFDMATGLKSGYKDFFRYYLCELITKSKKSTKSKKEIKTGILDLNFNIYQDLLFKVGQQSNYKETFELLGDYDQLDFEQLIEKIKISELKLIPNGKFINEIFFNLSKNKWVDIEQIYFKVVFEYRTQINYVKNFNSQLDFIKKLLLNYLNKESEVFNLDQSFQNKIKELIHDTLEIDKVKPILGSSKSNVNYNYFVNFNYTKVLENTLRILDIPRSKYSINNIHGKVDNFDNMIFGFGDENSNEFKELLSLDERELLKNIKTFNYLADSNYDSLNRFINGTDLYQVIILGHSCGLSDKVLLNEIFQNDNCFSIKIHHYGGIQDYIDKTMNISRIIEDPLSLRNKVFRYDEKNNIPQNKNTTN